MNKRQTIVRTIQLCFIVIFTFSLSAQTVTVDSKKIWTNTGIDVVKDQQISITASGLVYANNTVNCGPEGITNRPDWDIYCVVKGKPHAGLIMKIGNGTPVFVGNSYTYSASDNGRIFLGVNDTDVRNNKGEFTVILSIISSIGFKSEVTQPLSIIKFRSCPNLDSISYKGPQYNTVLIGNQCWLKENLNVGIMIDGSVTMKNDGILEKYCYNNDPVNCEIYGGLYQWDELMKYNSENSTGICPEGWHIPTENDFQILMKTLGGMEVAGSKLKDTVSIRWQGQTHPGTNESGFTAISGGKRGSNGIFQEIGTTAYFASSNSAGRMVLQHDSDRAKWENIVDSRAVSVRCIKTRIDEEVEEDERKRGGNRPPYPPFDTHWLTCLRVEPELGTTKTLFKFDASSCCQNLQGSDKLLKYKWDWDSKGGYDTKWSSDAIIERKFKAGKHKITVKVKCTKGSDNEQTASVKIIVGQPEACFTVKPKVGIIETLFFFDGSCSSDMEDPKIDLKVRWNFDGDGWDTKWSRKKTTTHKFKKLGIFPVKMQVKDSHGILDDTTIFIPVIENHPPKTCFEVDRTKGTMCDVFTFDASCSTDLEDPIDSLKFCWFFDWGKHRKYPDKAWSKKNKIVRHKYEFPSSHYTIRLGVMDIYGKKRFIIRESLEVTECEIIPDTIQHVQVPPPTTCPKKEYEFYFPFDEDKFHDSLDIYASMGYKLIYGSFVVCFFEREVNNKTIYPVKALEETSLSELNELAKQHWVVVNGFLFTYLIQDINAPLYEYTYGDDISRSDMRQYKNNLPGGKNIQAFNNLYGNKGWELVYIAGSQTLFRRISGSTVKYKYKSFIFENKDENYLQELGKKGWQFCAYIDGQSAEGPRPVILKQRVGMGDAFSFKTNVTNNPNTDLPDYFQTQGRPEKQRQWIEAFNPLLWDVNNFGQAGWTYEMFLVAHENYYEKDQVIIVFQVPASCY